MRYHAIVQRVLTYQVELESETFPEHEVVVELVKDLKPVQEEYDVEILTDKQWNAPSS